MGPRDSTAGIGDFSAGVFDNHIMSWFGERIHHW
jgi:hypothetical protein